MIEKRITYIKKLKGIQQMKKKMIYVLMIKLYQWGEFKSGFFSKLRKKTLSEAVNK